MGKIIDLTGQIFNNVLILEFFERKNLHTYWKCKCHCGNIFIVTGNHLKTGHTKSCGCLNHKGTRKYNEYKEFDTYFIGYTFKNDEFIFDKDNYEEIKNYCWYKTNLGYFETRSDNNKPMLMHRMIMKFPLDKVVDHIDGNKSDNRKENLRLATVSDNICNCGIRKSNTSGVTGVSRVVKNNKWKARIRKNNIEINLGTFEKFEDAVKARLDAEKIYHGEFAGEKVLENIIKLDDIEDLEDNS